MRSLDPARDDAGVRLRTLRLRRGMSQVALADLASVSAAFVSMVETGQRSLRSADHILAMADVLRVSPFYLADGRDDAPSPASRAAAAVPFPARCDSRMLVHHQQLARQFIQLARADSRAAGDWLRRLAREPAVSPWLLLDQLTTLQTRPSSQSGR
jgi:transcriptional regulator with XRE-family HTH domain